MKTKLGILAGTGDLPAHLIAACQDSDRPFCVFAFEGAADPAVLDRVPHHWVSFARVDALLEKMHQEQCISLVMAGGVSRPDFKTIRPGRKLMRLLPKVIAAARRGDGALLETLVVFLESEGFSVVGAEEVLLPLKAPRGPIGICSPDEEDGFDIAKAVAVVDALGPMDVGQAVVVREGQVLAVEAAEGTDAMLERCVAFRGGHTAGVLVKMTKPQQERRVDLPTIGVKTVEGSAAAGLKGIAVEAGGSLIVDRGAVVAAADRLGLFVSGIARGDSGGAKSG